MKNLFTELHEARVGEEGNRFGTGWEDLFTEQLTYYLGCDPEAAVRLAASLLGGAEVEVS